MNPKFYVLMFCDCEPVLNGPYDNDKERDKEAKSIFNSNEFTEGLDSIGWLDQSADGTLNVGCYTDEDLEPIVD